MDAAAIPSSMACFAPLAKQWPESASGALLASPKVDQQQHEFERRRPMQVMKPMKPLLGAVIFAASVMSAGAQTTQRAERLTALDSNWIMKAAQGGMAEVELGKLAASRSSNNAVKEFGQRMVDDHSKANDELSRIAASKGVTLPTSLSAKDQATKDRLSKLNGEAFDRAYMNDMVKDHHADVAEFQKEANSGQDPDVKAFAGTTLPTLQEHLHMAEAAQNGLKK
jgi:putative membrane protein